MNARAAARAQPKAVAPGWDARLRLGFEPRDGRSVIATRLHSGPLSVQRGFYPEPDGTCHAYILHPPGGVVGGDCLSLEADLAGGARVLLTTPAATKFYRSAGARATQRQLLRVGPAAQLEWLPQEMIAFDGAALTLCTRVELAAGGAFIGAEVLSLGRPASGERFTRGEIDQRLEIVREQRPLLLERARYAGAGPELSAAWGLGGHSVVGALVCVTHDDSPIAATVLAELRAAVATIAGSQAACSQLAGGLVCRYLGDRVEGALNTFRAAWSVLRPHCMGKPSVPPRIWST